MRPAGTVVVEVVMIPSRRIRTEASKVIVLRADIAKIISGRTLRISTSSRLQAIWFPTPHVSISRKDASSSARQVFAETWSF